MTYDITKKTAPAMPNLGKGLEFVKLALSQISPDMREPIAPTLFDAAAAHISETEFMYPDLTWKELCGMMDALSASSAGGKGQLQGYVEAMMRGARQHDTTDLQKLVEWQRTIKSKGANKEKPVRPDVSFWFPPSDVTNPAFIQNAWKKGCVLYILNGQTWTRAMGDFVEWLVYFDLWSKNQIFGDMLKDGDTSTVEAQKSGPKNMLSDLPDSFNEAQLEALRVTLGKSQEGTKRQLRVWLFRKFITYSNQTGLYTKTEDYLLGNTPTHQTHQAHQTNQPHPSHQTNQTNYDYLLPSTSPRPSH